MGENHRNPPPALNRRFSNLMLSSSLNAFPASKKTSPRSLSEGAMGKMYSTLKINSLFPPIRTPSTSGPERAHVIAPDRADAPHEIAFKDRKPVSLDSLAPSGPRAEMHRRIPDDRDVHARIHLELHEVGVSS